MDVQENLRWCSDKNLPYPKPIPCRARKAVWALWTCRRIFGGARVLNTQVCAVVRPILIYAGSKKAATGLYGWTRFKTRGHSYYWCYGTGLHQPHANAAKSHAFRHTHYDGSHTSNIRVVFDELSTSDFLKTVVHVQLVTKAVPDPSHAVCIYRAFQMFPNGLSFSTRWKLQDGISRKVKKSLLIVFSNF